MSKIEELRGNIDRLHRSLHLNALKTRVETDADELIELQDESLSLQAQLREAEAALGQALRASEAGRLDARSARKAPGKPGSSPGNRDDERPGGAARDESMGSATTGLEARVELRMLNVPTSMVHLLARHREPLVTVSVTNTSEKTRRIRVTTQVEGFSASAVGTREIASKQTGTFEQFPAFFPDRVATVNELTCAALHVHVEDLDGKTELHESYPIPLLARTTAVLWSLDPSTGNEVDLTRMLAAWVTPNAPEVLDLLRRAADFSRFEAMLGYQTDPSGVREHVRAIYEALKAAGIVYVNSPVSFGNHEGQFIQRIRLPRESVASRSANCIDGTVLMASLLEATALDPAIVLIPGHAYLAWRTRPTEPGEDDAWEYVETTMIATDSFDDACKVAEERTSRQLEAMRKDPERTYVKILAIPDLRREGITPME